MTDSNPILMALALLVVQYHELCRSLAVRVPTGLEPEVREQGGDQGPF
jgi:hypothetical protein